MLSNDGEIGSAYLDMGLRSRNAMEVSMIDFTVCDGTFTCVRNSCNPPVVYTPAVERAPEETELESYGINPLNGHDWVACSVCNDYAPF